MRRVLEKTNKKINTQDRIGRTPLHDCLLRRLTHEQHKEVAILNITFGASVTIKDNFGRTPLDLYDENECKGYEETTRSEQKPDLKELLEKLSTPSEILARGPDAVKAFKDALKNGEITVVNSRLMFLGQEGSGKTSCVKAMLGKVFDKEEPSTDGIVTTKTVFQTVGEDCSIWEEQKDVDEIERTKQIREHAIATNVAKTFNFTASTSSSDRGRIAFPSTSASPLEGTSAASVSEIDPRKKSSLSPVFIRRFKGKSVSEDTGVSTNGKGVSQDTAVSTSGKGVSQDTGVSTRAKGVSQDTEVSTYQLHEMRKKVIDKLANKSSGPSDVTCIWDYAGQLEYYITHRFFLTDGSSYGVVFSLLDALDELAKPRDPQKEFLEMTNLQSILFWIRSIFEHAVLLHGSESKNLINGMIASPTISLIGTHMDLLPGSDAEKQAKAPVMVKYWRKLNKGGILEEPLARHLWRNELESSEDDDDVVFKDFIELMKEFGLLFEKFKKAESEDGARLFVVPSRMKTKNDDRLEVKEDDKQTVSIYVTPKDFLPDAVYDILVVRFVSLSQENGYCDDPELFQNQAKIIFDDKHYLRLGRISIDNKRSLKLEISRMKTVDADGTIKPAHKPHPDICKEVLQVLKQHLGEVYPSKRVVGYALKILCLVCSNTEEPHFQELEYCLKNENVNCDKTGELITMPAANVKKLFAAGILHQSSVMDTVYQSSATATPHQSSATHTSHRPACSDKEFIKLKTVVSKWYDRHKCLPMLKVLFRDVVDNHQLSPKSRTMDLLNILFARGHLSSQNLGLLCDTISITKQLGLLSEIKQKLPSFPDVEEGTISTKFTPHRQKLVKFGMVLTPADVKQIDGIYNTPCKEYTDGWSMISDLENRLIISEGNMKEFTDNMKFLNILLALNALTEGISSSCSLIYLIKLCG
ncbi:uncharacterized protein LOC117124199 [Anneissia japonica]|uniref:uncharacterized protein LOC117124199 n=1 Tax=Anneissia japonica TaxID=1529436 RepID=UPI0014259E16|nr:uncharacterized protein LOC117124199 [Anneissia japonica]